MFYFLLRLCRGDHSANVVLQGVKTTHSQDGLQSIVHLLGR